MHWLSDAAARSGLKPAPIIPPGCRPAEAWEIGARAFGTSPTELARRLSKACCLPVARFDAGEPKSLRLVPEKVARRYNVFPLREDDRFIVVASADPHNIEAEQALAFASGRRVRLELAPPHLIEEAINSAYSSGREQGQISAGIDADLVDSVKVVEASAPEPVAAQEVESAPVVRLTNCILRDAVLQRASDIHVEPGEGNGTVRFRVDGVMRVYMSLPMAALHRVVSRIKVLAKLDIADRTRPQDGRTRVEVERKVVDLRVSTVPLRDAEKAVIRVLRPESSASLEDVGIAQVELERLRRLLGFRDGIVLVTGPTGSGKTTTMYGALRELAGGDVNITTVEDPVEYELAGVAQIQVDPRRGVTFATALRAILRQDPDVIFVGEIRDLETAEIAVQAAMTGHLVLATLHTNDAVSAVARLLDLGLDRAAIAATVRGALAQRLVRRVCQECKAAGCSRCGASGYFGRLPIIEVACFNAEMADLVNKGAPLSALQKAAVDAGMRTLRVTGEERVALGETTASELARVIGDVTAPAAQAPASTVPSDPGTHSILVVDDDAVQRLLVSATLTKHGFQVVQSEDGAAALDRLTAGESYSLVVTDLHMPRMDGDALIRSLRANPSTASLPVVVLTGSDQTERESELIEIGADDYMRKPIDPPRLLARVRAVLRRAA